MPEKFLHRPQVCAAVEQVGCSGVAQRVRTGCAGTLDGCEQFFHD